MAWIELHQSLPTHRKTLEAADLLDITPVQMVGHLTCLWLWALDNTPTGSLANISPRMVARAAQWVGDPTAFTSALWQAGFTSHDDDGQLEIHDWYDYAGKLVERRATERERLRERRAAAKQQPDAVHSTLAQRTPNIAATTVGTVPNRTQPNQTEPNQETNTSPAAPASIPDEPLPFDEVMTDDVDETTMVTPLPDKSKTRAVPKPGAEAVGRLNELYRQHIQPKCKVPADVEIKRMLQTFTPDELEQAIVHCRDDPWFMDNNAHRGAAWFFGSAKRMDAYVNGKKQGAESGAKQQSNGRTADTASRCGPGEASPFSKFSGVTDRT